jgi:hypothetical protein
MKTSDLRSGVVYQYFSTTSNKYVEVSYEQRKTPDGYYVFRRLDTLDEIWVTDPPAVLRVKQ